MQRGVVNRHADGHYGPTILSSAMRLICLGSSTQRGFAEVWTPDAQFPIIERERLTWHPRGALAPFVFELSTLLTD